MLWNILTILQLLQTRSDSGLWQAYACLGVRYTDPKYYY